MNKLCITKKRNPAVRLQKPSYPWKQVGEHTSFTNIPVHVRLRRWTFGFSSSTWATYLGFVSQAHPPVKSSHETVSEQNVLMNNVVMTEGESPMKLMWRTNCIMMIRSDWVGHVKGSEQPETKLGPLATAEVTRLVQKRQKGNLDNIESMHTLSYRTYPGLYLLHHPKSMTGLQPETLARTYSLCLAPFEMLNSAKNSPTNCTSTTRTLRLPCSAH